MSGPIHVGRKVALMLSWDDPPEADVDAGLRTASGTLDISLAPPGGRFHGARNVGVTAGALERFAREVSVLLEELTGSATLEPLEDYGGQGTFALTATLEHGKGALAGFVATHQHEARLTFAGVEIDQTELAETARQLRALLDGRFG